MKIFRPVAALMALVTLPAMASAADDVAALRAELQALKSEYSARVDALEARLRQLETANTAAADAALTAAPPEPAPTPPAGSGASAFNPAMSLILGGSLTNTSRDPDDWRIAGFVPASDQRELELISLIAQYHRKGDPDVSPLGALAQSGDDERLALLAGSSASPSSSSAAVTRRCATSPWRARTAQSSCAPPPTRTTTWRSGRRAARPSSWRKR